MLFRSDERVSAGLNILKIYREKNYEGCWPFRRFHLCGTDKLKIEWVLLAIAHNITKMALEE